jgi:hypothetical protein
MLMIEVDCVDEAAALGICAKAAKFKLSDRRGCALAGKEGQ